MAEVTLVIDGREVTVPAGLNLIEAARTIGIEIPHFCWHPHLSVAGNCRMCLVEVEGLPKPEIACNTRVREGLVVRTDTEVVRRARRATMEFLLLHHPLDCPICDQSGECLLQDHYFDHAAHRSRLSEPKVTRGKRIPVGEHLVLDQERCIACSRCVRFGREVTGTGDLALHYRSDHVLIDVFPGREVTHPYQVCLADVCPVGALTARDFRFRKRAWLLAETASVCPGCATGCNIRICHEAGRVHRLLPRRNDAVNRSWMCDFGRLSWHRLYDGARLLRARVAGQPAAPAAALEAAAALLVATPPERVGLVLGAQATCEANHLLLRLRGGRLAGARLFHVAGRDPGRERVHDRILIHADKNPNSPGVALLAAAAGGAEDGAALRRALDDGVLSALLVLEDDALGRLEVREGGPGLVALAGWESATVAAARVVLPVAAAAEQEGTVVSAGGRLQRFAAAVPPPGDARPARAWLAALAARLGTPAPSTVEAAFADLVARVPAFAGLRWDDVGPLGVPLPAMEAP